MRLFFVRLLYMITNVNNINECRKQNILVNECSYKIKGSFIALERRA